MTVREWMRVFANALQIIQQHANESRKPALRLVSFVSEKLRLLNNDSMI